MTQAEMTIKIAEHIVPLLGEQRGEGAVLEGMIYAQERFNVGLHEARGMTLAAMKAVVEVTDELLGERS